jgi:hypothetical protein
MNSFIPTKPQKFTKNSSINLKEMRIRKRNAKRNMWTSDSFDPTREAKRRPNKRVKWPEGVPPGYSSKAASEEQMKKRVFSNFVEVTEGICRRDRKN